MPFVGYQEQLPCSLLKPRAKTPSKTLGSPCPAFLLLMPHRLGDRRALGRLNAQVAQPSAPVNPYPHLREELEQCKKDLESLPSGAPAETSKMLLLRESPWGKERSDL